jgi:hypothetical protein
MTAARHPASRPAGRSSLDQPRASLEPQRVTRRADLSTANAAIHGACASPGYARRRHQRGAQRRPPRAAELRKGHLQGRQRGRQRTREVSRAAPGTRSAPPTGGRLGCARGLRRAARSSGGKLVAAFAPTSGQNGATGAGAHAQAKTVRFGPPAIVGLKRALTQGQLRVWIRMALGSTAALQHDNSRGTADPRRYGAALTGSNVRPGVMTRSHPRDGDRKSRCVSKKKESFSSVENPST